MNHLLKVLVVLPNHELPPRRDSPGISYLVHNQLTNSTHDITTLCIKSSESKEFIESNYASYIIPNSILIVFKILFYFLGARFRFNLLGVQGLEKFTRIVLVNFLHLCIGWKYNVVVYHNYFELIKFGSVIGSCWNNKVIYYFHGSGLLNYTDSHIRKKHLERLDGLITISGENNAGLNVKSVNIINNYAASFKFDRRCQDFRLNREGSKILFCTTSNIDGNKNIHHAIALLLTSDFTFEWEFHIFGKVLDISYFNNTLKPFFSDTRIRFFGEVVHDVLIEKLIDYSFVFQLSKLREGNSMSLIEAMVEANVVGVGSNIGGIPMVLDHGNYGLVLELNQSLEEQTNVFKSFVIEEIATGVCRSRIFQHAKEHFSPSKSSDIFDGFIHRVVYD